MPRICRVVAKIDLSMILYWLGIKEKETQFIVTLRQALVENEPSHCLAWWSPNESGLYGHRIYLI